MRLDRFVHQGLRVDRLVLLIVAEAAVAAQVDDYVAREFAAVVDRQMHRGDARVDVVGVDVHDRQVVALREVGGVAGRARADGSTLQRQGNLTVALSGCLR
jgi:hypothetical protein